IHDLHRQEEKQPPAIGGSDFQKTVAKVPADLDEADDVPAPADHLILLRRYLDHVRPEFRERTWQAFWRAAVEEHATADIARDLGMTANAVRLAKAHVLGRLRQE